MVLLHFVTPDLQPMQFDLEYDLLMAAAIERPEAMM